MKLVDYLIVGGSAAGTTAADIIRSHAPEATITIVTDENHEMYSRVLIPHYIRGTVQRDQVFLKKPEWYVQKNIVLLRGVRARRLEVDNKVVTLSNGEEIEYGKLLITVGGNVIPLSVPGVDRANICYMRTVEDADNVITKAKQAKKAVIIGGGFIGLEFASCFKKNGVSEVTMLVKEPYFWSGKLDEDSAGAIGDTLLKNGVKIITGMEIDHFEGNVVVTRDGQRFGADVYGVGIGIKPDFGWLADSGISIDKGIVTNEFLETNLPDVYAAGDCAQFYDVIFERQHIIGNWANATSQGSAVGKTLAGEKTVFETASSYSITFFDAPNNGSVTFIGVTEDKFSDQVIKRGTRADAKVTRIFVKKMGGVTRIVGATVVNNPSDVAPLTVAIKNKVNVGAHLDDLGRTDFDLKTLSAL